MKLTTSFELGSKSGAASGCIAGVLCRILRRDLVGRECRDEEEACEFGGEQLKKNEQQKNAAVTVSPGIVARLMGLDSFSVYPCAPPETISRAQFVNLADGLFGAQWSSNGGQQIPKSQSSREVHEYFRKENEFFVLTFGGDGSCDTSVEQHNINESRGRRKLIKKRRSRSSNLENVAESKLCEWKSSVTLPKEIYGSTKGTNRSANFRKRPSFTQGTMEAECSSQNSSPVSVLDLLLDAEGDCLAITHSSFSEEEDYRKKHSSDIQKSRAHSETAKFGGQLGFRSQENESNKGRNLDYVARDCSQIWPFMCRLGEDDLKNNIWVTRVFMKSEEVEEIGSVVEREILDLIVQEVLVELSNYFVIGLTSQNVF